MRSLIVMFLMFLVGCATGVSGLLRLQDRELLIHPDKPGLAYPHKITKCERRYFLGVKLGKKCKSSHKIDFYNLNDKATRDKLINAGFSCKSKMRFKY